MAAQVLMRDTDADWKALGETDPYWGVITHDDYRAENLNPDRIESFYRTGTDYIEGVAARLAEVTGAPPRGRALDFGCGVGRLTEAMTAFADETVGVDISPGMLAKARAHGGKASYVDTVPQGRFDWINSFIVFQHIPPERGLPLIADLLGRLAPGGHVSLHVTVWREPHLVPPAPAGWRRFVPERFRASDRAPTGVIMMYDYDLSAVVQLLNQAGVAEMTLVSTDHGGHHGVIVLGRKST